jgi:large subunit ribosomal protein L31
LKEKIHPKYVRAIARCACGNEFEVGSTKETLRVEICSKCHPFYTGNKARVIDTTGRVDRFKKKYGLQ